MKVVAAIMVAIVMCAGVAYAGPCCGKSSSNDPATQTVKTVGNTAQTAVSGTSNVAETSVTDTVNAPGTAITAVKDTANTAFRGADKAIKTLTGEE